MFRIILASAALLALTATASVSQGSSCDARVEAAMKAVMANSKDGAKRVARIRMITSGYDYCMAGSMVDATKFFEMAAAKD